MNGADACAIKRAAEVRSLLLDPPELMPLREELSRLLDDGHALGTLALRRAKFKPGRKLTAYYGATVLSGSGRGRREVAVIRSVGAADRIPAEPRQVAAIEAEAAERGLMRPFRSLEARVPAQHLRVLVAPLDPVFPHLVRLSDPAAAGRLLPFAGGRVSVTALRYRPGQRHLLRYVGRGYGRNGAPPVFAKLCGRGEEARALRRETALADWLEDAGAHVTAVAPIDGIGEPGVLFYLHADGVPLKQELWRLRETGAALRTLHRAPPGLVEAPHASSLADEARGVARAVEHIDVLLPPAAERIHRLLDRAQDGYARLPRGQPTVIHGDFKLEHLRWASGRMVLIDLDRCRLADPAFDIGKFLADLHWWEEQAGTVDAARAGREFLDGYFGDARASRRVRARVFEAVLLAKIAARRVPLDDPRWPARVDSLVARAEGVLEAVERDCSRPRRRRPRVKGAVA